MNNNQFSNSNATLPANHNTQNAFQTMTNNDQQKLISTVNNINEFVSIDKQKKTRRKKADNCPRDFVCDICQKTYLSAPALSSHKKAKHNIEPEKKSRGRPRKNVIYYIYNIISHFL